MKILQLNSPNNLKREIAPDLKLSDGFSKIKITRALLSEPDVSVFSGAPRVK